MLLRPFLNDTAWVELERIVAANRSGWVGAAA
jgi:hypothetical protein